MESSWGRGIVQRATDEGNWKLAVQTPAAGYTAYSITIADKDGAVTLVDVLVGEVWLCGGQSTMEMPLNGFWHCPVEGSLEEVALSGQFRDKIRLVKIPKTGAEDASDHEGKVAGQRAGDLWNVHRRGLAFRQDAECCAGRACGSRLMQLGRLGA